MLLECRYDLVGPLLEVALIAEPFVFHGHSRSEGCSV